MLKDLNNKNKQAFTLIELLIVIAIIGLLSTIAVASLSSSREKARIAKGQQFSGSIRSGMGYNIVGEWNFNDGSGTTAKDTSGYDNDGTIFGATPVSDCVSGSCLNFNGTSDYVQISNSTLFNTTNLTISAWVNFVDDSSNFIFEKGNVNTQYSLFSHGTDIVFRTKPVGEPYDTLSTSKENAGISNNQWHYIVGSYDGSEKKLYVDGVLKLSRVWAKIIEINNNGSSIGRFGGTTAGYYFNGYIDDVRLYSTALTLGQIQQNYAEGLERHRDLAIAE